MVTKATDFKIVFLGFTALALVLAAFLVFHPGRSDACKREGMVLIISTMLVLIAFYTVLTPKRDWAHYLLYLPIFMGIFAAILLSTASRLLADTKHHQGGRFILLIAFGIFCIIPLGVYRIGKPNPWIGTAKLWHPINSQAYSEVGKAIVEAFAGASGRLCIWGYNPDYHTETKYLQSTRLNISTAQFNPRNRTLEQFFRETYLEDLQKNSPLVFVDATAPDQFPSMNNPEKYRHEVIPALKDFIADNYDMLQEVNGVRIFRLKGKK